MKSKAAIGLPFNKEIDANCSLFHIVVLFEDIAQKPGITMTTRDQMQNAIFTTYFVYQ